MRTIHVDRVTERVREAVQTLNFETAAPTLQRLVTIRDTEPSPAGRVAMDDIVENREVAAAERVPMCQDTGLLVVFAEVGQEVRFVGGALREAITEGMRQGFHDGYLRASAVAEPLFERSNTGDNTPAVVHFDLVAGDRLRLQLIAKGFGAENMSRVLMLTPADGIEGVRREVVRCVEEAGPNACPPVVVGVGVGGTLELAAVLAKRALLREVGDRHPDPRYAALELDLLERVNATGIGPQGWGGVNTALDVRVEYAATHIAGLPLGINLDCHLQRHGEIVL